MGKTTAGARALLAASALILAGCSDLVGPDFATPQTPEVNTVPCARWSNGSNG